MNISVIRGAFLNPFECQLYAPLTRNHQLTLVGADWQFYKHPMTEFSGLIQTPHLWASSSARIHPALPVVLNRLRSWTLGESYALADLEKVVGGSELLHPAETYTTMTYECLEIRKRRRCKVVATVWENLPHMGETHPRRRARKRRALRELDGFLAVTETSRRMLLEEGAPADRIEVVPMAVDLAHFRPAPRDPCLSKDWGLAPDEKVILFVGRWVEEKGIHELLKAIPEVLSRVSKPLRFCFVGAGPLEHDLRAAAGRYPGRLHLVPFAPYDQLPVLHNMADVFVLPSKPAPKWQEQFGYVLAESMACGKAIVATRSGSIPDVVGEATSLVSPGDSSALSAALIHLLTSDEDRRRLQDLALQRARSRFDAIRNARLIEAFYQRTLGQTS